MNGCTNVKEINNTIIIEDMKENCYRGNGKHKYFVPVIVNFNGSPCPGFVKDVENGGLEVLYMRQVVTQIAFSGHKQSKIFLGIITEM